MSDYTTPAVTDEAVSRLATNIREFADNVRELIINYDANINGVLSKQYTVNHEPQIDLPFNAEYDYICEKVNKALSNRKLDRTTHIFISGYLPNGKTIRSNSVEQDDNGITHSRYAGLYINGKYYYTDYTCRAEEGAREKLNVLIVGAPKMGSDKARLDVDYADIPLEDFKMIVFDDVDEPISPDIDSFLGSKQIDTLKVIGSYKWTYSGLCTLRRLELTKDILVINQMDCPCVQELIIPNVQVIPNLHAGAKKSSIVKLDASNVKTIQNLNGIQINTDLTLDCNSIADSGLYGARIDKLTLKNACTSIGREGLSSATMTELKTGVGLSYIGQNCIVGCPNLQKVIFDNIKQLNINNYHALANNPKLTTVEFGTGGVLFGTSQAFEGSNNISTVIFNAPITTAIVFTTQSLLTEQTCLNIINYLDTASKVKVGLHSAVKTRMANDWYCKLVNGKYVSCAEDDEEAMLQTDALIEKGGTLA